MSKSKKKDQHVIRDSFVEITNRMWSDFEEAKELIRDDPNIKGHVFENILRDFLLKYLPKKLDIATGILVDSKGKRSKQLDVIIFDAQKTPRLFKSDNIRIIPIECAYAVIEVKSKLSLTELKKTFANMISVRNLSKTAFYSSKIKNLKMYGKTWKIWPVNYFIFAFDSPKIKTVKTNIEKITKQKRLPLWKRIDSVCILRQGIITNKKSNGTENTIPDPTSKFVAIETQLPLLIFYMLISHSLQQATIPDFRFQDYIDDLKL